MKGVTMFIFINCDDTDQVRAIADGKMDIVELPNSLLQRLYDYFEPQMPYGTKKEHEGDPFEFIEKRLHQILPTKLPARKYMMATKAYHLTGEISSDKPDICSVDMEVGEYYVGSWFYRSVFMGVYFPKDTTRELNESEAAEWDDKQSGMVYL